MKKTLAYFSLLLLPGVVFAQAFLSARQSGPPASIAGAAGSGIMRVSMGPMKPGSMADGNSLLANSSLSADGTKVAFHSAASNLVSGDVNGCRDIFVRDLTTNTTTLVSVDTDGIQGNGRSFASCISADGSRVAFASSASNFDPSDTNNAVDVFVHDLKTGVTIRASVNSSGEQSVSPPPQGSEITIGLNADGTKVVFDSDAKNLVPNDTNGKADIFVRDLTTGETERVSVSSDGIQGNGNSSSPCISSDGSRVAFESDAGNLVSGDTNGYQDVFVHDLSGRETILVSVNSDGLQGNYYSYRPEISADGMVVAFDSISTNLVSDDTNNRQDVYLRNLVAHTTIRVSVFNGGAQGNFHSYHPSISPDGKSVTFLSSFTKLEGGGATSTFGLFLHNVRHGTTSLITPLENGEEVYSELICSPLSSDGNRIAFVTRANRVLTDDTNGFVDVFVRELSSGTTTLVTAGQGLPFRIQGNEHSGDSSVSADGTKVAFSSGASNLVAGDENNSSDVFVADLATGELKLVSVRSDGTQGDGGSGSVCISGDGTKVAFLSTARNLVSGNTLGNLHVYVHDLTTGVTIRASGPFYAPANASSFSPSLNADGSVVAFYSSASNLAYGDTNRKSDVFVFDIKKGKFSCVSVDKNGVPGKKHSFTPSLSADGTKIAFASESNTLATGDKNPNTDIFVRDLTTGITTLVSMGNTNETPNNQSLSPTISADGTKVAFVSFASNLVKGDTNRKPDAFIRDLVARTTTLVSQSSSGVLGNQGVPNPFHHRSLSLTADGTKVLFSSSSSNLVVGNHTGLPGLFIRNTKLGITEVVEAKADGEVVNGDVLYTSMNADGQVIAFSSFATNLVPGDTNGAADVFVRISIPPTITNISPNTGKAGTAVTITGTNFLGVQSIQLNGQSCAFTVLSPTTVRAIVPAHATSGLVVATTPAGSAEGSQRFVVAPSISAIAPPQGPTGTSIKISGENFDGVTAVKIGDTVVPFVRQSSTRIKAFVPGRVSGKISISTPAGPATSREPFINSTVFNELGFVVSPQRGAAGAQIQLSGVQFGLVEEVRINGVASTKVDRISGSLLVVTVPIGAATTTAPTVVPITVKCGRGDLINEQNFILKR